jgi:hypothetical protein
MTGGEAVLLWRILVLIYYMWVRAWYWVRPYDMLADRRRWFWQRPTRCGF